MKNLLLSSLIAAAAAVPAVAGVNNINYQAVIKDANGVMADKTVDMKFELVNGKDVVYTETQAPKTNAAGMVVCQLGGDDKLADIEWGDLTLRVSIKLGADYEVISNEAISSVPTALYAVKSGDSDMIIEAIEGVIAENEETKATLMGMGAEIARIDGIATDFENLGENLDNLVTEMNAHFEEVNGQLENLNQVGAVVRANEEAIEALQEEVKTLAPEGIMEIKDAVVELIQSNEETASKLQNIGADLARIDGIADDFENLGENLDNMAKEMTARFEEVHGQLENLNQLGAVVRSNEAAIEDLSGVKDEVVRLVAESEENSQKINSFGADIAQIEGLATEIENLQNDKVSQQDMANFAENIERTLGPTMELVMQLQEQVAALQAEIEALKK